MENSKKTKHALFSSIVSLILCISMLLGSTYAWFTDTATTGVNLIQSGELKVDLVDENDDTLVGKSLAFQKHTNGTGETILWEPGVTYETQKFYVKNEGNLSLKYKLAINGLDGDSKLLEAIDFYLIDGNGSQYSLSTEKSLAANEKSGALKLVGKMKTSAGNEYQNLNLDGISVTVYATQASDEYDSYNNIYDLLADYSISVSQSKYLVAGETVVSFDIEHNSYHIASVTVPADAIANAADPVTVSFNGLDANDTIDVGDNEKAYAYDIDVTNLKTEAELAESNSYVRITVTAPKGLVASDDSDYPISVFHNGVEISAIYDAQEGTITFDTASFSPYAFSYETVEVTTLEDLRYYLQRESSGNITLTADIVIDLNNTLGNGSDRETTNEDSAGSVVSYVDDSGYTVNYARRYYKGSWEYFGSRVRRDKTLDLNGHTITLYGDGENIADGVDQALFYVQKNSGLNIVDGSNTSGENGAGTIKIMNQMYAVWSVSSSAVVNIYDGIFMSDEYVGDTVGDTNQFTGNLLYSSGGCINVYGGYYMYSSYKETSNNNGFNVMDPVTIPRIYIYEGVHLSKPEYRQGSGSDDDSILLAGGCEISAAETGRTISATNGEVSDWYVVNGQKLRVKDEITPDKFLYRVGNGNAFTLDAFFEDISGNFGSCYAVRIVDVLETKEYCAANPYSPTNWRERSDYYGYIKDLYVTDYTYAAGSTWDLSEITFTNGYVGPVKLQIYNTETNANYAEINLNVVDGKNITTSAIKANSSNKNVVLLNDITLSSSGEVGISDGYTLFGNGFTITDERTDTTLDTGVINVVSGNIDNVKVIGYRSTNAEAGINDAGRAPTISVNGDADIYNSYIYGGKYALKVNSGNVFLDTVTIDGGSNANIEIMGGTVTLNDCVTTTDTRGGSKGMGIAVTSTTSKLTLEGTFKQYNWLPQSSVPESYSSILTSVYGDSTYAYTYNGTAYVNMGIFFFSTASNFPVSQVQTQLVDDTNNEYGYIEKTYSSYTATCYTAKASMGSSSVLSTPTYTVAGSHAATPRASFDFTTKNYVAMTDGSNEYCYYDSTVGAVRISFDEGGSKIWDTDILTVTKNGNTITPTVTMNGTDYTGKSISFTTAGKYTVKYTYVDPYNYYSQSLAPYSLTYTKTVDIIVTVIEPEAVVYSPSFTYADGSAAKQVTANNKIYVMPDVNGVSDTIGSTTVGGETIYYPIVTVGGSDSSGSEYSSGKIYLFCPAFTAINITDYDKDTGEAKYKYTSSTKTWPHDISATTKVTASEYYGHGSKTPYTGGSSATYEVCQYNSTYGLSFVTTELERDVKATTKLVEFYYVGDDGNTYYYYIQYSQSAVTYKSCVTPDTLITLADGTKKRVDSLTGEEQLLVWNLETGKYDVAPIVFVDSEDETECKIVHLYFSDSSEVKVIDEHGFFDLDLGQYIYIDATNYADYIGHRFVAEGDITANGWDVITLDDVVIETEVTTAWSPVTFEHLCYFTNGVLSMPGGIGGLFNIFEVDTDTMTYDSEQMKKDIDTYGLFSYEDFGGLIPEIAFEAFNGAYLKVAIGKGLLTWEDIAYLAERYMPLM